MPILDRLSALDRMPDSALISTKELSYLTGRSRSSIWRDVRANRLPRPIAFGPQARRWRLKDVRTYMEGGAV